MVETFQRELPHGITLGCRAAGERGRPLMVFLHGFPEAAFIWDELLDYFAKPEHGGYRCIAPNLRGFEKSSSPKGGRSLQGAPADPRRGRTREERTRRRQDRHAGRARLGRCLRLGLRGGVPRPTGRLVIINSPHPGTFTRELKTNPEQQKASAYMNFLAHPRAEEMLAADDFKKMWPFFTLMKAGPDGFGWLTEEVKNRYREVWGMGLTGACNLYRVTPMKPPLPGGTVDDIPTLPRERLMVGAPTLVLWALDDAALLPGLLEGLDDYVPTLEIRKVPHATHWIIHEQPQLVAQEIEAFQRRH